MTEDAAPKHRVDRTIYTHSELFISAEHALARDDKAAAPHDCLTALVLAAFAVEAYLNFAGEELCPYWDKIHRIGVRQKLGVICKIISFEPDFGNRPYESLNRLWRVRNILAHARTETLTEEREGMPPNEIAYPQTSWEQECTQVNARRILDDISKLLTDLHQLTGIQHGILGHLGEKGGSVLR